MLKLLGFAVCWVQADCGINIKAFMWDLQASQQLSKCEGSFDELK